MMDRKRAQDLRERTVRLSGAGRILPILFILSLPWILTVNRIG